jgi:uncharacterized cupredoxin-like copper-binding protein
MKTRLLGLVLIALGALGLIGTSVGVGVGPRSQGPGWMASMHERMMGAGVRPVNLVLMNDGDLAHDITIPAVGFRVAALPGTRVSASLTAGPGEYEFFCSVAGHRDAGMEGVIVAT